MSRHWYDLDCLAQAGFGVKAMEDKELFEAIRSHRKVFTKVPGVNYDSLKPSEFGLFPPESHKSDWDKDYNTMKKNYIYKDAPTLDELHKSLGRITEMLKNLKY